MKILWGVFFSTKTEQMTRKFKKKNGCKKMIDQFYFLMANEAKMIILKSNDGPKKVVKNSVKQSFTRKTDQKVGFPHQSKL